MVQTLFYLPFFELLMQVGFLHMQNYTWCFPVNLSHVNSILRPAARTFKKYRKCSPPPSQQSEWTGTPSEATIGRTWQLQAELQVEQEREKCIKQVGGLEEAHFLTQDREFCPGIETQRCKRCFSGAGGPLCLELRRKDGGQAERKRYSRHLLQSP